jgi:hypothetical protein
MYMCSLFPPHFEYTSVLHLRAFSLASSNWAMRSCVPISSLLVGVSS